MDTGRPVRRYGMTGYEHNYVARQDVPELGTYDGQTSIGLAPGSFVNLHASFVRAWLSSSSKTPALLQFGGTKNENSVPTTQRSVEVPTGYLRHTTPPRHHD